MADELAMNDQAPSHFRYRAVERATGRVRVGEISGDTAYAVRASLRRAGWEVERIDQLGATRAVPPLLRPISTWLQGRRRQSRRPIRADLCEALAALLQAGLPLEQAVGSLAASPARGRAERRMLRALRDSLRHGESFHQAASEHPDWFDRLDVAMLAAGQAAGELPQILADLGGFHQRGAALGHKLLMALAYPGLLTVAALVVVAFISRSTLPQLLTMLADANIPAPLPTTVLVTVGQGLTLWWPLIVVVGVSGGLALRAWARRVPAQGRIGALVHGNLFARAQSRARVARLASVLGQLLHSGVPLAEALDVAADTAGSQALREVLTEAGEAVRRGEDLSAVVERSALLDAEFAQLLRVGEQAGELASMLGRVAERYERAATRSIERLGAVLEPAAIVVLATVIGAVVLAAVLPLVAMGDLV
ncbi:MAG: type II secretion system F family protein [Planctomycetota bacterium]|nr:type II secretion system F family protein [Planctomycetota bacterium]